MRRSNTLVANYYDWDMTRVLLSTVDVNKFSSLGNWTSYLLFHITENTQLTASHFIDSLENWKWNLTVIIKIFFY